MALEITGARVYDSRIYAVDFTELPSINVMAQAEVLEVSNLTAPRDMDRTVEILLVVRVKANNHYADLLDSIGAEIEAALSTDLTLSGLVKDIMLTGATFEFEAGEEPIGKMEYTYSVDYRTKENNAEIST